MIMNFKKIFTLSVLLFACTLFVSVAHAEVATSTKEQKIEVLSPSGKGGEESFKRGEKIYYTYTLTKNSKKLEVSLYGGPKNETVYKVKRYDGWGLNKKVIAAKDTAKLVPGQYGLLICDYTEDKKDPVCDSSDGVITITDDTALEVATSTPKEQSITIISPNGGETYNRGDKITYTYKLKTNSKNLVVKLLDDSTSQVAYEVKRYDGWGTNKKVIDNDATAKIPAGNYRLQICDASEKNPVCDMSDSYFSILGKNQTDSSKKIEIVTPKKNVVAKRNTEVKFSYKTLDSSIKGVDLYLISENNKTVYAMAKNYVTSSTFSFAAGLNVAIGTSTTDEIKNGAYIVAVCPAGTAARSTDCASFKVEITGTDSVINLVKPKANEIYKVGTALPVDFTTNTIGTYQVNLATSTKGSGELYPLGKVKADKPGKVQTKWIIPTNTTVGAYHVMVELLDTNNSCLNTCGLGQSESFSIVKSTSTSTITSTTTEPSIKVVSPNGGEIYTKGQSINLKWKAVNVDSKTLEIDLLKSDGTLVYNLQSSVNSLLGSNKTASPTWHVPTDGGPGGQRIDFGDYKIRICLTGESGICDVSDQKFLIREMNASTTDPDPSDGTYGDRQGDETRTEEPRIINGTPTDACKNIPGDQAGIPSGYTNVGVKVSGNCKKIDAKDENSEPTEDTRKNQEQKIEKICQILKTTVVNQKTQQKKEEWKTVKCDGDAFQNAKPKERRTQTKNVEKGTQSASETSYSAMIDLEMGMAHSDVIKLQKFLNNNGYTIETMMGEPGSQGYESNYFGQKTKDALMKYQKDKGINPVWGFFGPQTKRMMGI